MRAISWNGSEPRRPVPRLGPTLRGLLIVAHLLLGLLLVLVFVGWRALRLGDGWTAEVVAWWYRRLCRLLALRVTVEGRPVAGALLVANHVSWLDIPVLGGVGRITFLSKAEVRRWPLIGWMAARLGTLFIERGASQAPALVAAIGGSLHARRAVVIFPEGTTGDGRGLRRFHPRLFAAAQQPGVCVQPVALRYGSDRGPDAVAPFVGDDSLLPHLLRVLRHPGIEVRVRLLEPLPARGLDRRALGAECRARIGAALGLDGEALKTATPARGRARAAGGS